MRQTNKKQYWISLLKWKCVCRRDCWCLHTVRMLLSVPFYPILAFIKIWYLHPSVHKGVCERRREERWECAGLAITLLPYFFFIFSLSLSSTSVPVSPSLHRHLLFVLSSNPSSSPSCLSLLSSSFHLQIQAEWSWASSEDPPGVWCV